jgi:hypothetical protein
MQRRSSRRWPARLLALAFVIRVVLPLGAAADTARSMHIVVQSEPALATYQGGIAGLAATNPEARGEVTLDPTSAASTAYLAHLRTSRSALLNQVAAVIGRSVNPKFEYNYALNGFAANLSATEANVVAGLPGVAFVQKSETLHTLTDAGPQWMNADQAWDGSAVSGAGSKGERIVAGIIDTGVNPFHPSFAGVGPVDGYAFTNPRGHYYGVCNVPDLTSESARLCNNKLIGLYDFTGVGVADDVGHGSHTASTTAGNLVEARLYAPTVTLGPTRISGVAPHANIISYKVCFAGAQIVPVVNVNLGSCPIQAILAGIDQATADVVDVINFSIGGGSVDPWQDPLGLAFFGAHAAGVFVAASAGNSGPSANTMGRPANSPWLMAVGASTHNRRPTASLDATQAGGAPIHIEGMAVTSGAGPAALVDARDIGNDLCTPFTPAQAAQVTGAIVVCTQGEIARVDKGQNVKDAGGVGMVLIAQAGYKNSVIADTHVLPAVMVSEYDGAALRAWLAGAADPQATLSGVNMETNNALGDRMAAFSSRGPDLNSPDVIKPDVTAPGVAIWAAWMRDGSPQPEFNIIQGTSMSSPHAAGAGALVRALHRDWTPDQIKSALMSTAFTAPAGGKETVPVTKEDHSTAADPFDMGAGRIDIAAAARAGLTLGASVADYMAANPTGGGRPATLNLASLANSNCAATCTWTRTLTSTSNRSVTYDVVATAQPGFTLSVSPSHFTVDPIQGPTIGPGLGDPSLPGTQVITITATNTGLKPSKWAFGEVRLVPAATGLPAQHLPVAIRGGSVAVAPDCDIPETTVVDSPSSANVPPYADIRAVTAAGIYPTFVGDPLPNITLGVRVSQLGLNGQLPPNQHWRVTFVPPGTPEGTSYFVSMATDTTGKPTFTYGTLVPGTFTTLGAPENGVYDLADNSIHWTIAASKVGNPRVGDTLTSVGAGSGVAQPGLLTTNQKTTSTGSYQLTDCDGGGGEPTPTPTATPTATGSAPPACTTGSWLDTFEPAARDGWQVDTAENAMGPASPTWALMADPMAHSLADSWYSNDPAVGDKDDRLIAPAQDITASSTLTFWHRYHFEQGFDGGVLELSTDAGATWTDVGTAGAITFGGYTGESSSFGRSMWTGGPESARLNPMSIVTVNLGGFVPAGQTSVSALVRWRLLADALVNGDGWWIDDVQFDDVCVEPGPPGDGRVVLHFEGNLDDGCTGDGRVDLAYCDGPFLEPRATLDGAPPARWATTSLADGAADRNIYDPNWTWNLSEPTTLDGPMTVEWWGNCNLCIGFEGDWIIRLWADGAKVVEERVATNFDVGAIPVRLSATINVPSTTATGDFVLHVDPVYVDAQNPGVVLYDSRQGCGEGLAGPCDSLVRMPVAGATPTPTPTATATPSPTVEPTPTPSPAPGDMTTGGGWLAAAGSRKVNFTFQAANGSDGLSGFLQLNDKATGVKVDITTITSLGAVGDDCDGIAEAANTIQLTGSGTYNGLAASFRACVADNGHPGKAASSAADQLYLECTSGCSYRTSASAPSNTLGGGNISVSRAAPDGEQASQAEPQPWPSPAPSPSPAPGSDGSSSADSSGEAETVLLQPVLLDRLGAGVTKTFIVTAYDVNQRRLGGTTATITIRSGSLTTTLTALTSPDGTALFSLTGVLAGAEYVASIGTVTSNAVSVTP